MEPFVHGTGSVKLDNGETWTARLAATATDAGLDVGTRVNVTNVMGATVEVAPPPPAGTPIERSTADG
jgi:membrane protein implicated in regulation of membrane protease activity